MLKILKKLYQNPASKQRNACGSRHYMRQDRRQWQQSLAQGLLLKFTHDEQKSKVPHSSLCRGLGVTFTTFLCRFTVEIYLSCTFKVKQIRIFASFPVWFNNAFTSSDKRRYIRAFHRSMTFLVHWNLNWLSYRWLPFQTLMSYSLWYRL